MVLLDLVPAGQHQPDLFAADSDRRQQEADRNASLPDPIALHFWHLERLEQVHSTLCSPSRVRWRYNPAPKSTYQLMLATEGLTGPSPFDESANYHCARVDNRQQVEVRFA